MLKRTSFCLSVQTISLGALKSMSEKVNIFILYMGVYEVSQKFDSRVADVTSHCGACMNDKLTFMTIGMSDATIYEDVVLYAINNSTFGTTIAHSWNVRFPP